MGDVGISVKRGFLSSFSNLVKFPSISLRNVFISNTSHIKKKTESRSAMNEEQVAALQVEVGDGILNIS